MNRIAFFFLMFLCTAGLSSCRSGKDTSAAHEATGDTVLTGIERGACFGACPEFKAVIYTTGFAEYFGRKNVAMKGYYQAKLTKEQLDEVKNQLRKNNMEQVDSAYVNTMLADYPAYFLTVRTEGKSRRVLVNHEAPPANITAYTAALEEILPLLEWKSVPRTDIE